MRFCTCVCAHAVVCLCVCARVANRQAYILPNNSGPPLLAVGDQGPLQPMNSLLLLFCALPRLHRAEMSNKRGLREVTAGGGGGGGAEDKRGNFCGEERWRLRRKGW